MALEDDVIQWSMQASMKSTYGGSIGVTNPDSEYDKTLRTTPVTIELKCTGTVVAVTGTTGCFNGDVVWINGLIGGTEEREAISERMISFTLKSYFARLAKKSIYTESDTGGANTTLTLIADEYAAIPPALYSFNVQDLPVCAPIQGSNMIDEMKKKKQLFIPLRNLLLFDMCHHML